MHIYKNTGKSALAEIGLFILHCYFVGVLLDFIRVTQWIEMYIPMLLTVFFSVLLIVYDKRILPLGANVMIFIYTVFSLLALLLLLPLFPDIENIRSAVAMSFLYYDELVDSIAISCIGIIVFMLATSVFSRRVRTATLRAKIFGNGFGDMEKRNSPTCDLISQYSVFLLAICAIYFTFFILTHLSYLAVGYTDRTSATANNSLLSHMTVIMALASAMLMTVADGKKLKIGLAFFAICSVIQFLMGNRGEVYYPILACVAVYTKRKGTFKKSTMAIGVVGSLVLISAIRVIRTVGAMSGGFTEIIAEISPIESVAEAFGEMGFQIGTVAYMLRYLKTGGSFQYGATYIYSFQSFLCKYIPFLPTPDKTSPAAIKTIMPTNYFAFTNIGEAYFNFGIIGVYIFCIFLAFYLVNSSKFSKGLFNEIFTNMFLVELILWVRNSSGTMPVYLAWSVVLLLGAKCFCGTMNRGRRYENNDAYTV